MQFWLASLLVIALAGPASASGILYAIDGDVGANGPLIYALDPTTGAVQGTHAAPTAGPTRAADGITLSNDGLSIFVADGLASDAEILERRLAGGSVTSFPITHVGEGITQLADGTLAVASPLGSIVVIVDPVTQAITRTFATAAPIFGMEFDGTNILALTRDGVIQTYSVTGAHLGSLTTDLTGPGVGPTIGLAFTGSSYFVSQASGDTIYELDLTGMITNSFAVPTGTFIEGLDWVAIPEPGSALLFAAAALVLGCRRTVSR